MSNVSMKVIDVDASRIPWNPGEPHPQYQRTRLIIAYLELGLRWLHDRARCQVCMRINSKESPYCCI